MIHMEAQEDHTHMIMIKGKRTKRQRPSSPFGGVGVTSSSSSAAYGGGGGGEGFEEYANSFTSATTSGGEVYESTEEEEDMANCLILLAQGDVVPRISERRLLINEIATATSSAATEGKAAGFYVYECKTCNRTFPSFQALGGHRASHKKPKAMAAAAEEKKAAAAPPTHLITTSIFEEQFEDKSQIQSQSKQFMNKALIQSNVHNHKVNKIHECSICGSEFTSGQALGGHMRRHRTATAAATTTTHVAMPATDNNTKQRNNILPLDLNLPAPEDHDHHHQHHHHHHQRESKFQFVPTQQSTLVFNAPSLVDCHY